MDIADYEKLKKVFLSKLVRETKTREALDRRQRLEMAVALDQAWLEATLNEAWKAEPK